MTTLEVNTLSREFLDGIYSIPNGEKVRGCIQCGTCSASCPSSFAMDYGPREVIAALRAGMLDRVLESNTVWLCASCYLCSVRCPAAIPFTDVMYELKRLGVEKRIYPKDMKNAVLAQAFVHSVERYGRNWEMGLIREYFLRTSPMKALKQIPLAWKLLMRGRLHLRPHRIKGIEGMKKMMAAISENGKS